jgi:Tfp pilus assembly protein PilO
MKPFLERLRKLVARYPIVSASIVLSLILAAANYFLWQWHQTLTVRHNNVREQSDKMLDALASHSRLDEHLKALEEATNFIDRNLLVASDLAANNGYFYQIETVSRARMADLVQLNSPAASDGATYVAVPFTLRVTGTYRQLMSFINQLEEGPHVARITQMDFMRESNSETLTVSLTVHFLGKP